ncbi:hypothetical protein PF008_g622 [Phytophthora fragariae]|uniref:Ig-like domain-containing protein n=1 Tax=Phytophthora fragariae TaxID=53985 RepID=A0A6G0SN27_9STRA|nr:hypothetical protein PF008_g622 [Phytophthora fragariae]
MPSQSLVVLALCLVLSAVALAPAHAHWEALAASSSSECCSTCIGKTSNAVYDYDPVIYAQCSNVTGGICCFDCGDLGDPQYGDTISYASDGVTALVKAGTYISFTWSSVVNVTYISLKSGQKKTKTPTISDTAATEKSSTFLICAKAAGTIYFRGWGSDSCREASQEYSVTVEAGDSSTTTCDASDVTVTTSSSTGSSTTSGSVAQDATVADCNAQRASVQTVDGVQTCVCVSDWTNPPECDRWPIWKWLVTVGGGVAALFSIIISIRAFLQGRKKKQEAEDRENLTPMGAKSDVETLEVTPDSGYHSNAAFKYDPEADRAPGGTRKADDREFTL